MLSTNKMQEVGVTNAPCIDEPLGDFFFVNEDTFRSFKNHYLHHHPLIHPKLSSRLRDVYEAAPRFGCYQHLQTFAMATVERSGNQRP